MGHFKVFPRIFPNVNIELKLTVFDVPIAREPSPAFMAHTDVFAVAGLPFGEIYNLCKEDHRMIPPEYWSLPKE